eukprot:328750-Amphidinium_carterae.1
MNDPTSGSLAFPWVISPPPGGKAESGDVGSGFSTIGKTCGSVSLHCFAWVCHINALGQFLNAGVFGWDGNRYNSAGTCKWLFARQGEAH